MQNKLRKSSDNFTWIPNSILNDNNISLQAKGLWAYINSKPDGWNFSSKRIADDCKECERTIKSLLQELEELGLLLRERLPSGRMIYSLRQSQSAKSSQCKKRTVQNTHSAKIAPVSNKDIKEIKSISNKDSLIKDKSLIKGDPEVAELFDYWQEKTGIQPANTKLNRRSAYNLIRSKKLEGAKKCVDLAAKALKSSDKYAPRVASFAEFYGADSKLPKLEAWQAKQEATKPKMPYFFQRPSYLDEEDHKGTIPKEKFAKYREIALRRA